MVNFGESQKPSELFKAVWSYICGNIFSKIAAIFITARSVWKTALWKSGILKTGASSNISDDKKNWSKNIFSTLSGCYSCIFMGRLVLLCSTKSRLDDFLLASLFKPPKKHIGFRKNKQFRSLQLKRTYVDYWKYG